jgi:hypothetical protein
MRFLLRQKFSLQALKLVLNTSNLMPCGFLLFAIQLVGSSSGQPAVDTIHDRCHHFQIVK